MLWRSRLFCFSGPVRCRSPIWTQVTMPEASTGRGIGRESVGFIEGKFLPRQSSNRRRFVARLREENKKEQEGEDGNRRQPAERNVVTEVRDEIAAVGGAQRRADRHERGEGSLREIE